MPSVLLTNQSGGQNILSGWVSGHPLQPVGGVQLRLSPIASGNAYVGLSGTVAITSGNMSGTMSGGLDGMIMKPGDTYFIPKLACGLSGNLTVQVATDAAASGQGRMFFEVF